MQIEAGESAILEVHLISAQNLKPPPANMRRTETYAVVWVDPSTKLRTRVDRVGSENPTWNDKFFFRVDPDFLSRDTSGVSVEIFAVGYIRDYSVGSVRLLLSNVLSCPDFVADSKIPYLTVVGIRRPSGMIHGVLNIGVMVITGSDFTVLKGARAIGYRDLMGESIGDGRRRKRDRAKNRKKNKKEEVEEVEEQQVAEKLGTKAGHQHEVSGGGGGGESGDNSCLSSWSWDLSDECESTTSSSSTASTVLQEWNGMRELAGKSLRRASCVGGFLCGFLLQR